MEHIKEKLCKIIFSITNLDNLEPSDRLSEKGITSINIMTMLGNIENEFGLEIPEQYLTTSNFESVNSISDMIVELKNQ
jgi:acyl carrier protein